MTTVTVNVDNVKHLSMLTEMFNKLGLSYNVDQEGYDEELEASLARAEEDSKAGRVRPHAEVWADITARYKL